MQSAQSSFHIHSPGKSEQAERRGAGGCRTVIYDLKRQINSTGCLTGPETSWITAKIRRRPGEMLEKWKKNESKRSVVWQNWEEVLTAKWSSRLIWRNWKMKRSKVKRKDRLKIWRGEHWDWEKWNFLGKRDKKTKMKMWTLYLFFRFLWPDEAKWIIGFH